MLKYLVQRIAAATVAFFLFTAILFFSVNWLIPGDYVDTLVLQLQGNENREALREELGLNAPLYQQYLSWLGGLLTGDLGEIYSIRGRGGPVSAILLNSLPSTLLVFITGAFLAFIFGLWLGKLTGWNLPWWLKGPLTFGSIATYTAFPPWLGFLFVFLFIDYWNQTFETRIAKATYSTALWRNSPVTHQQLSMQLIMVMVALVFIVLVGSRLLRRYTGQRAPAILQVGVILAGVLVYVYGSGNQERLVDIFQVAWVPLITFTVLSFGDTMLIMRSSMEDTRFEAYVTTAKAIGMTDEAIRNTQASPNAILPVITRFVVNLPYLITAAIIVERATGYPGLGSVLFDAIYSQNTYVFMGGMAIIGLITLFGRIALDVTYGLLDPRIRFERTVGVA